MNPLNSSKVDHSGVGDEENSIDASGVVSGSSASLIKFWLKKNLKEVPSYEVSDTFVDQNGVVRHKINWSEVREETEENADTNPIEMAARRGAVSFIYLNKARTLLTVFACDYKKVWNGAAIDDTKDDFGSYALLFQTLVLIFFDKRSMKYFFISNAYFQFLCIFIMGVVPGASSTILPIQIIMLLFIIAVHACGKLNKMNCYSQLLSADQIEECKCTRKLRTSKYAQNSTKQMYELSEKYPYWILIKTCFGTMMREFRILTGHENDYMEVHTEKSLHNDEEMQPISVMSLESKGRDMLDRLDEPIECKYYLLLNVAVRFLQFHERSGTINMPNGGRKVLVRIFTLLPLYILGNGVFLFFGFSCIFANPTSSYMELSDCDAQRLLFYGTLGTSLVTYMNMFVALIFSLSLVGMMYGARLVHELALLFVNRYSPLRQLSMDDDEIIEINDVKISVSDVRSRLARDATEHYLFTKEFVRQASALYSPFVAGAMLSCATSLAYCIYDLASRTPDAAMIVTTAGGISICSFVILFPMYCIAYANSAMEKLVNCFTHGSGPDDFKCIGGKEQWLTHLVDSPAYWTLFGMPLTFRMFYSVGSSIGGAFLYAAFALLKRYVQ